MGPLDETQHEQAPDADQASAGNGEARAAARELPPELQADDLPSALFGYDRYTIVKLLDKLRERFQELGRECGERDDRIRELELELLRSHEGQRLIGETLLSARQEAQAVREEARRSAQELLKAARKQATRIQEESERDARATANELVDSAERDRKAILEEAGRARAFVEQTHEQLSEFLLAAVKWYEQVKPSQEEESRPESPPVGEASEPEPQPVGEAAEPEPEPQPVGEAAEPEPGPQPVGEASEPEPQPVSAQPY